MLYLLVCFCLLVCATANRNLVDTFLQTMDTPLSSLSLADASNAFHIATPSSSYVSDDPSHFDFYFVLLTESHYPYEFEENVPFFSKNRLYSSVSFIGGTDRALLVVCKETLLHSRGLRHIIDSYSPVPLLARIHPAVIRTLASQWNGSASLNLTYSLLPASELPHTLSSLSIDKSLSSIPTTIGKEANLISFLHSSLSSSSRFPLLSSSLCEEDGTPFIRGSPRVTVNNLIALLKSSVVERVGVKPHFSLLSLREAAHGRRLNVRMRQYMTDGEFKEGAEDSKLLKRHGMDGNGVIIGIGDSGIDEKSTFFFDKSHSVQYDKKSLDLTHRKIVYYQNLGDHTDMKDRTHGTHVAGMVAGKANREEASESNGLASGARIAFVDVMSKENGLVIPDEVDKYYYPLFYDVGVRVSSNSWGEDEINYYDSLCEATDSYMWIHNDFLVLFAAGNSGVDGLNTVISPGYAKNVLTVGAVYSDYLITDDGKNYVTYFSSRGNPELSRIKPDVVATGIAYSARAFTGTECGSNCDDHDDVMFMGGTSMATPATAGAVAIITQYLKDGHYHGQTVDMRASLLKAMVIHSTMPTKGTCNKQGDCTAFSENHLMYEGHGRVQLDHVLRFNESDFELFLYYGQVNKKKEEFTIRVPLKALRPSRHSFKDVKVTMAYTDYPADTNSRNVLVNDVDLTVTDVSGKNVRYPNELNENDRYNNVEVVKLPSDALRTLCGTTSEVVVHVKRHALSTQFQPMSLVITGDFAFDAVKVEDDTTLNYEDVPGKEPWNWKTFLTYLFGALALVAIVVLLVLFTCGSKKKTMPRVTV